ncbi:MAG: hypothetical protein R3B09_30885 [Nannocystaceae bacterium]
MSRGDDGGGDPIALAELPGARSPGSARITPSPPTSSGRRPASRLADLPTPVERAAWLDAGAAEVWIKLRDDHWRAPSTAAARSGSSSGSSPAPLRRRPADRQRRRHRLHHLVSLALFLRGLPIAASTP